jgi:hypothetical protein
MGGLIARAISSRQALDREESKEKYLYKEK